MATPVDKREGGKQINREQFAAALWEKTKRVVMRQYKW